MYRKQKRIPTILGLAIVLIGLSIAVFYDQQSKKTLTQAQEIIVPENIHFTNITDSSISLSWTTTKQSTAKVLISSPSPKALYYDDLDSDNISRPRLTHYFTFKNLKEDTKYTFEILNGEKCFESNCPKIDQKTGIKLKNESELSPVHGQLVDQDGSGISEAIIYLTLGKASALSTRTDSLGMWVMPLNNIRNQDLLSRIDVEDNDVIQITSLTGEGKKAELATTVEKIRKNPEIPVIVLGNSYNYTGIAQKGNVQGLQSLNLEKKVIPTLNPDKDLLFPRFELDTTQDSQPRFKGYAKPQSQIKITVKSDPQSLSVNVANDGTWNYRPQKPLSPGIHEITIQGYDKSGKPFTMTRKFIVLKSGEAVLGESTPSASISPTQIPTIEPSQTPVPTTQVLFSPTPQPPTPSTAASPTLVIPTTTDQTPPRSGNQSQTALIIAGSLSLILVGVKLLVFP